MKTITFVDGTSIEIENFSLNKNMTDSSTVLIIHAVGGQDVFNQFTNAVSASNCETLIYADGTNTMTLEGFNNEVSISLKYDDDQTAFFVDCIFYKEEV